MQRTQSSSTTWTMRTPNSTTLPTGHGMITLRDSKPIGSASLKGRLMTDKVTELPKPQEPEATVIPFGKTVERHPDGLATGQAEQKYREPQIHLLRRVLGDVVLDIFPIAFIEAVEQGYKFWEAHPSSYLDTLFDSEDEKDDTLAIMRAYSEIAGLEGEGYTIATRAHENPAMLVWRAQTRRKHKTTTE